MMRYKLLFILCLIAITFLSLQPLDADGVVPLPRLTSSAFELHVLAYGVAMLLGLAAFGRILLLPIALLLYGALLEAIQGLLPSRAMNPFDILANALGIAVALLINLYLRSRRVDRRTTDSPTA